MKGIVSRAFGSRPTRKPDDPPPDLHEVLAKLDQSERENPQDYSINRIELAEAPQGKLTQAPTAKSPPSAPAPSAPPAASTKSSELEAHRHRLEQLLEGARQIETMLAQEAAQARALSENLKLEEKRAALTEATEAERKITAEAQAFTQNGETATVFQAKVDAELIAAQQELSAAEASVNELQSKLRDAQNLVVVAKAKAIEYDSKSKEAAKRAKLAKDLVNDAECRIAKCREAREGAELALRQAEEIASSIALTAETLKRIRELGKG